MKRLVSSLVAIILCLNFSFTAYGLKLTEAVEVSSNDLKTRLDEVYPNNELSQYADAFCDAAETDEINVWFLVSIAVLESGNGKSHLAREHGNLFGMKYKGEYMHWDDKSGTHAEYGIYYEAWVLRHKYIDRGADTIETIGAIYCDEEWATLVEGIWRKLEEEQND